MQVIVDSIISMHSMLMLGCLGAFSPRKILKKDPLGMNLRTFYGHNHACYISYITNVMLNLWCR